MVTGRLFHKVTAAFLKHLLPYVTPRVVGTLRMLQTQTVETLSADNERQVSLSIERLSLEVP